MFDVYPDRLAVRAACYQAARDLLLTPPTGATHDTLVDTAATAAATTDPNGATIFTPTSIMAAVLSAANVAAYGTTVGAIADLISRVETLEGA